MKRLLLAGAPPCLLAMSVSGCYWLASYEDLTSSLGDADTFADAQVIDARADESPSSFDGGLLDATASSDARVPEAGPFCPPDGGPLVYCMDFDGIDAASLGLGSTQASVGVVSGVSVSPPSSMHVSLYGAASNGAYDVQFSLKPTSVRLEFQVRSLSVDWWVTLLGIDLWEESTQIGRGLNVVLGPNGEYQVQEYFSLPDGGNEQNGHPGAGLDGAADSGAWHHVVLSLTVDDAKQQYFSSLSVDDRVIEQQTPLGLAWAQGTVSMGVGVTYGGGGGPQFYFDNVRADFGLQ